MIVRAKSSSNRKPGLRLACYTLEPDRRRSVTEALELALFENLES
jgi:hypothetical protein